MSEEEEGQNRSLQEHDELPSLHRSHHIQARLPGCRWQREDCSVEKIDVLYACPHSPPVD